MVDTQLLEVAQSILEVLVGVCWRLPKVIELLQMLANVLEVLVDAARAARAAIRRLRRTWGRTSGRSPDWV